MGGTSDTEAFLRELLLASEVTLRDLIEEGIRERSDFGECLGPLVKADPDRAYLVISFLAEMVEPDIAYEFWRLAAEDHEPPESVPFCQAALDAAERALADDRKDERRGWLVAHGAGAYARARLAVDASDEARETLVRARELLELCGFADPAFNVLADLLALALLLEDGDLIASLTNELLDELKDRESSERLRALLFSCAYAAYYELGDLDLTLRCTRHLNGEANAREIEGFALLRKGQWKEALAVWNEVAAEEFEPQNELNRAVAMHQLELFDDELAVLDDLVAKSPRYWQGYMQRGGLLAKVERLGDPGPDLIKAFQLAVEEQEEPEKVREALGFVNSVTMTPELATKSAAAFRELARDDRDVIRLMALSMEGEMLAIAGRHDAAARSLSAALALFDRGKGKGVNELRLSLVDELIASGRDQDAIEELGRLVEKDGDPEAAMERLEHLGPHPRVPFLRAMANASLMDLPAAEAELTDILIDHPGDADALRLRGIVRLSTAARVDRDQWNQEVGPERYVDGIRDLGKAAAADDEEARSAYLWAVDRARGQTGLWRVLMVESQTEHGEDTLIDGLADADALNVQSSVAISGRKWSDASRLATEARAGYEKAGMLAEVGRIDLKLADLALRQSEPLRALEYLERVDAAIPVMAGPFDGEEARLAAERADEAASRGVPAVEPPLDYLIFVTNCMRGTLAYLRFLRTQTFSAMGRHREALEALGDEREMIEAGDLNAFGPQTGEAARAVMSILRDAGEPHRALDISDLALETAVGPLRIAAVHTTSASCWVLLEEPEKALKEIAEAREALGEEDPPGATATLDYNEALALKDSDPARIVELLSEETVESIGIPPRQAATLAFKADALADLHLDAEADQVAREAEALLAGGLSSIEQPGDQSISIDAWVNARLTRCELAARQGDSAQALLLQAGLKSRSLAVQRAIAVVGARESTPIEEAVAAERDELVALIRHAGLTAGAISWPHLHRLGSTGRSLIDGGEGKAGEVATPTLDLEKAREALNDAQGRLAKLQQKKSALPKDFAVAEPADLDALREMLAHSPSPTTLIDMLVTTDTCYLSGLAAEGESWIVAVPCPAANLRAPAEAVREDPDWSDRGPVWGAPALKRIVDAVQERTSPGEHLVLIRHGVLHSLPLHAIEGKDGLLIDRNTVSYGPSSPTVLSCRREGGAAGLEAVIIADSREDLANARLEGEAVAEQLGVVPIIGMRADRRRFLAAVGAGGPKVLHVACHGTFDEDNPEESLLLLAGGVGEQLASAETDLSARELAQLPLRGSIVVLSACHSGVSLVSTSDEPFGLTRAVLAAGARAVIAARWAVDDIATWLLFRKFTELCRTDGIPVGAALAQAQRWLRQISWEEMAAMCDEAQERGQGASADVDELLSRRSAEGALRTGRRERAVASAERADLLAVRGAGRSGARGSGLSAADDLPLADRRFWAAFEVVGDWASRYPPRRTPHHARRAEPAGPSTSAP
jgi:CHAT domain-containing protein/tetratricopeptide (TPR) repeat protein